MSPQGEFDDGAIAPPDVTVRRSQLDPPAAAPDRTVQRRIDPPRPAPTPPDQHVERPAAAGYVPSPQRGVDQLRVEDGALSVEVIEEPAEVFLVSVHGGAGGTRLARAYGEGAVATHAWPTYGVMRHHWGACKVALVARSNHDGLRALQSALRQWASGQLGPHTVLLGVMVVDDAPPGRLRARPAELRQLRDLVVAGAPKWWRIPWVEDWRLGEDVA